MPGPHHIINLCCQLLSLLVAAPLAPQAQRFVPGPELLHMDPGEACDKLRLALKVLGSFKSNYFTYRALSAVECPSNPWRFQNTAVFARLDRCVQ